MNEINTNNNVLNSLNISFKELFDNSLDGIFICDLEGNLIDANPAALNLIGYNNDELRNLKLSSLMEHQDFEKALNEIEFIIINGSKPTLTQCKLRHKNNVDIYVEVKETLIKRNDEPFVILSLCRDITDKKRAEAFFRKQDHELEIKNIRLEEINTALSVLMEQRRKDHIDLQEKILTNLKESVQPYIEKFKQTPLNDRQKAYIELIESGLKGITSPFSHTLKNNYLNLTSTEIRIADMIRTGKNSNEIGRIMKISERTVEFHRNNIRAKLGMRNKKINLRTYLLSLE